MKPKVSIKYILLRVAHWIAIVDKYQSFWFFHYKVKLQDEDTVHPEQS